MATIISWTVSILFLLILSVGFFAIIFGIPGTWIILLDAVLYGWITHFKILTPRLLLALTLLAIAGETLEFFLSIKGIKQARPARGVVLASFFGGLFLAIMMAPLFLGIGAIFGALIGAFGGAFLMEYLAQRRLMRAAHIGWKAFLGRLAGFLSKLMIASIMTALIVTRLLIH